MGVEWFPICCKASLFVGNVTTVVADADCLIGLGRRWMWMWLVPVKMLLLCLLVFSAAVFSEPINVNDSVWLMILKDSISRDPNNLLSTWNSATNFCTWSGITCDQNSSRVVALSLPHNGLYGGLGASIGELRSLEVLEFQGNHLSGKIPDEITRIPSLTKLDLSSNSFSGSIPSTLISHGCLSFLDLSNNQLSGQIMIDRSSKCESLTHLKLSYNLLKKTIPVEIGNCSNLRSLLLDGNMLEGRIPVEIGRIMELRVLDVSRNSLTERIPKELCNCKKLSILVLTKLIEDGTDREEFNAFDGGLPDELLMLPNLQILWAPRGGNLRGRLMANWSHSNSCSLRVLNLAQNYLTDAIPANFGLCKNLTFLDLSSNNLAGFLPWQLKVPCMVYFNISRNNISGVLPNFGHGACDDTKLDDFLSIQDIQIANANSSVIVHDFSWNMFFGSLPLFFVGNEALRDQTKPAYRLLLNNNKFSGSIPSGLVSNCNDLLRISINLNGNEISSGIHEALLDNCLNIAEFEAAENRINGSLLPGISKISTLQVINLSGNQLSGSLPKELGDMRNLNSVSFTRNRLTGKIPPSLGQLTSLTVLDLSHNAFDGSIPENLTEARKLKTLLLDHNMLTGEIPSAFSTLKSLTTLNVSYNNLSGNIPHIRPQIACDSFEGNTRMTCSLGQQLDNQASPPPSTAHIARKGPRTRNTINGVIVGVIASGSVLSILTIIFLIRFFRNRKRGKLSSTKEKVLVTFSDAPTSLSYENVVKATGNFSIRTLIGTGGFGSTYKAELMPGYLVAVKRLSIGKIQGIQQFDAEIRTLGQVRHKNLVTLIGYYVGEGEMLLIYNFLSGGNLDTFIHDRPGLNEHWSVIYKIATDIAHALAYLHYSCVPRILHRDIKPSNILLDEDLNAYLSDFGLARLLEVSQTHATTDVAGTFGYVAPEYATTCRVSDKADVYSFGVVMLELMSGKKSLDPSFCGYGNGFNIVAWARLLIKEKRSSELFSAKLWESGPQEKLLGILKLALTCTLETLAIRPSMKHVVEKLKKLGS